MGVPPRLGLASVPGGPAGGLAAALYFAIGKAATTHDRGSNGGADAPDGWCVAAWGGLPPRRVWGARRSAAAAGLGCRGLGETWGGRAAAEGWRRRRL